jgi:hypothetical protein
MLAHCSSHVTERWAQLTSVINGCFKLHRPICTQNDLSRVMMTQPVTHISASSQLERVEIHIFAAVELLFELI